jgi:crotonobetainyl-CoA:carnitine CoA-transferase CaiB-like acyl-CoA transferase
MKKIVTSMMVMSVLSMSLYGYSNAERVTDMQAMEMAMAQIQKGILSNDDKMVVEGVDNLKKSTANVEVAPKGDMDYGPSFAKQQSKNIMKYADKIKSNIEDDRKHSATSNYTKVLNECISCHNKLRKWR